MNESCPRRPCCTVKQCAEYKMRIHVYFYIFSISQQCLRYRCLDLQTQCVVQVLFLYLKNPCLLVFTSKDVNFRPHSRRLSNQISRPIRVALVLFISQLLPSGVHPLFPAPAFSSAESNEPVLKLESITGSRQIRFSERFVRETICNAF